MDFDETTLPSTLTVEQDGQVIPLRDVPFVKEAKDLGSLIKQGYDAHREVGSRVRKPDEYAIEKPATMPETLKWDEGLVSEFKNTMHKHGVPKGAAQDLVNLHLKAMGTLADGLLEQTGLKVNKEEAVATLKNEFGDKYDVLRADAGRLASEIFKTPEELAFFEHLGLGDHPKFLSILMRLAPLVQQDSSFMPDARRPAAGISKDDLRGKMADLMSNPQNPLYKGYQNREPAVMEQVEKWYKDVYGEGQVTIT
jgi:hypothetical protein